MDIKSIEKAVEDKLPPGIKTQLTALQSLKSLISSHPDSMSCGRFLAVVALLVASFVIILIAVHMTRLSGEDLHMWLDHAAQILGVIVTFVTAPYAFTKAGEVLKKGKDSLMDAPEAPEKDADKEDADKDSK